jgi:hypothetical protein
MPVRLAGAGPPHRLAARGNTAREKYTELIGMINNDRDRVTMVIPIGLLMSA